MKTGPVTALGLVLLAGLPFTAAAQTKAAPMQPATTTAPATRTAPAMTMTTQPGGKGPLVTPTQVTPPSTQPAVPGAPAASSPGAASQPATLQPAPAGADTTTPSSDSDMVMLPAFAEPVQLSSLVELVARTLKINVTIQGDIPGTVVFNAPIPVKKGELISLLDSLLEQQGFTITQDEFGRYTIHAIATIASMIGQDQSTTRIIRTPNIKPSSIKTAIELQLASSVPAGTPPKQYAYVDDLGLIIATDTPRRVAAAERLVARLVEEAGKATFTRIELRYLAASIARQRVLELVGATPAGSAARAVNPGAGIDPGAAAQQGRIGSLDNIADRLVVDAQGNALIFRGLPLESEQVRAVVGVIDVPNNLAPKNYPVGTWAGAIASMAHQRGLGEVTTINEDNASGSNPFGINNQNNFQRLGQANGINTASQPVSAGGPMLVVDESRGTIIYYATEAQHEQMAALIHEIDPQSETVIIGVYKLKNSAAEDVAAVIQSLISGSQQTGGSDLLNGLGSGRRSSNSRNNPAVSSRNNRQPNQTPGINPSGTQGDLALDSTGFVTADKANNQILVKAPSGQQKEFARLITKLDIRRPQVYIEAKIVTVTWSDDTRLAFETQLINAGGAGGLINTNFGLSTLPNGITNPKVVSPTLGGLTSAIIKSDQVPIILNALETRTNGRILSQPQILVDDNEEAEIVSVDSQPTSTSTTTAGNPVQSGFGGYEDAGTTLTVQPHISDAGYLGLKYTVELSSFTGAAINTATQSLPPPKSKNNLRSDSITIPSDSTVIVGGLNFDSNRLTKAQIPLLGDIPIIGLLFQDRHRVASKTTLYIFLTPHILRDPTFADLKLLTRGPQAESDLGRETPKLRTARIDMNSNAMPPRMPTVMDQPLHQPGPQPAEMPVDQDVIAPTNPGLAPDPAEAPIGLPEEPVRENKGKAPAPTPAPAAVPNPNPIVPKSR